MREQEHNNEVVEFKRGFKIVPRDETRPPVVAALDNNGFWHIKGMKYDVIPMYFYYPLVDWCVERLYDTWVSPRGDFGEDEHKKHIVKMWASKVTGKTLNKKIHGIWKRCIAEFDPEIAELHRKLYSVAKGSGYWKRRIIEIIENREENKYLIKDMIKYRAARTAVLMCHDDNYKNWRSIYSFDGTINTSLNKTLNNMPGSIVYYRLFGLANITLPEPATTRLRLMAYAYLGSVKINRVYDSFANIMIGEGDDIHNYIDVIKRSSEEDIRKAVKYVWSFCPSYNTGDFRKWKGIEHAFGIIFDYPHDLVGEWDIMGLAKRAEKYHFDEEQRLAAEERARQARWRAQNEKQRKELEVISRSNTALPPIPLPENESIKLLDSYNEVRAEGALMAHCIAMYAEKAVRGGCYLFHVNYKGEMASVEVSPDGYVRQSYGPRDSSNKASEYAHRTLSQWAKKLQKVENKTPILRLAPPTEGEESTEITIPVDTAVYADIPF